MIKKYRKKPVTIEAVRLTSNNAQAVANWCHADYMQLLDSNGDPYRLRINTLEGDMLAHIGDWIIKGVAGEFYPCKHEIFIITYNDVEEE